MTRLPRAATGRPLKSLIDLTSTVTRMLPDRSALYTFAMAACLVACGPGPNPVPQPVTMTEAGAPASQPGPIITTVGTTVEEAVRADTILAEVIPGEWDLLLIGGLLVDGTGAEPRAADVAIVGDRVVEIMEPFTVDPVRARTIVDISGLVLAPGFIDINGQGDSGLFSDGRALNKLFQGITTELMGESNTPAPINRNTAAAPDPNDPVAVRRATAWRRFGAWLEDMEASGVSVNIGSFLGGTTVRRYAMGFRPGAPSAAELDTMRAMTRRAMEDGALGVGTGLIYPPGSFATTDELVEVARVVHGWGGVYISHIRSESYDLLAAISEAIEIGERSGVPVEIYHLKAAGQENWHLLEPAIQLIEDARARGVDVEASMYPYTAASTSLTACLPAWASENGQLRNNLRDPEARRRMIADMLTVPEGWENWCRLATPEGSMITSVNTRANIPMQGRTIADLAADRGKPWAEAVLDFLVEEGNAGMVFFAMDEDNVRRKLTLPWMKFGTDAGVRDPSAPGSMTHPRTYGSYPKILGQYVRDEQVIPIEDAVRKMTSAIADRVGLIDRGRIAPGYFADLVVFDADRINEVGTYTRPHALSVGVEHVWVNGRQVVRDAEYTGALPGRFLRGPGARGGRQDN